MTDYSQTTLTVISKPCCPCLRNEQLKTKLHVWLLAFDGDYYKQPLGRSRACENKQSKIVMHDG